MIDYLRGPVVHIEAEYIVMDVRDIGYRVFTPSPYAFAGKEGAATVYIHHHVREDATLLFGFESRSQQTLFRKLLDVSGIGPRVALGVLSAGKPEAIVSAIQQENIGFLMKLPGIGKKTAQRMILDLKDKLFGAVPEGSILSISGFMADAPGETGGEDGGTIWQEAREALAALGYTASELDKAWSGLKESAAADESVDAIMKRALQQLFKG